MELDFTNKHTIITGGTGALGSAVTELLLESGARCSIPCYDASELENFDHKDHDNLFFNTDIDLTDEEATTNFYEDAVENFGDLWASIHIAGGFGMGKIEDTGKTDFMKQIDMNLITCFNSCGAAIHNFRKTGRGGRIVNVASRPALEPRQGSGMSAYTTSKAGVAALTQALAAEVTKEDILINAIAPSIIDTPANRSAMPDADYDTWPKPEEIARQIVFLASSQNTVTRGAIVPVFGKS